MNFRPSHNDDAPDINLIPLIDVLLVILIFLAATTTFTQVHELEVQLPQAQAHSARTHPMQLAISSDGLYALDGQLVQARGVAELAQALMDAAQSSDQASLLIQADGQAPHQAVVQVLEAARDAGITQIHFATEARTP